MIVFERHTDQARRVVAQAQLEARRQHRRRVGTKHILVGLIHEQDSLAASALESAGIRLADIRGQAREGGEEHTARTRDLPYTPRARTVLEQSTHRALRFKFPS